MSAMRAGGGMFVGCVVAGSVMLCCQGAKVRGALIRDVAAYAIAVLAVAIILWCGKVIILQSLTPLSQTMLQSPIPGLLLME